jgi:hypothetical protein
MYNICRGRSSGSSGLGYAVTKLCVLVRRAFPLRLYFDSRCDNIYRSVGFSSICKQVANVTTFASG